MPDLSAIEKLEAERAYFAATTDDERLDAVHAYVEAERKHNKKLGSVFTAAVGGIVSTLLVVVLIVSISNSATAADSAKEARAAAAVAADASRRTAALQRELRRGAIQTCQRTNESRVASIVEKHQSIITLRKTLHLWRGAIKAAPPGELEANPITPLFLSYVHSLEEELATKREGIRKAIDAQAAVAVRPGSPRVDCRAASLAAFHP